MKQRIRWLASLYWVLSTAQEISAASDWTSSRWQRATAWGGLLETVQLIPNIKVQIGQDMWEGGFCLPTLSLLHWTRHFTNTISAKPGCIGL